VSDASGIYLKVKTERLMEVSNEVSQQIRDMQTRLDQIGEIVGRSNSYWEADGQTAYISSYQSEKESIEEALQRFRDNVTNLQTIAGVYAETERAAVELTETLSSDVII
jgi:uncharacterized protein YukE